MTDSASSWFPVVAGFGVIALTLCAMLLFPRTWWARELTRVYGLRPTGPDGQYQRRDVLRGAGLSALLAIGLVFLGAAVFSLTDRFPNGSLLNRIGLVYLFTVSLLGGMAVLGAALLVWRALFWRSPPDLPANEPGRDA